MTRPTVAGRAAAAGVALALMSLTLTVPAMAQEPSGAGPSNAPGPSSTPGASAGLRPRPPRRPCWRCSPRPGSRSRCPPTGWPSSWRPTPRRPRPRSPPTTPSWPTCWRRCGCPVRWTRSRSRRRRGRSIPGHLRLLPGHEHGDVRGAAPAAGRDRAAAAGRGGRGREPRRSSCPAPPRTTWATPGTCRWPAAARLRSTSTSTRWSRRRPCSCSRSRTTSRCPTTVRPWRHRSSCCPDDAAPDGPRIRNAASHVPVLRGPVAGLTHA